MQSNTSYLTLTEHGIWHYQRWPHRRLRASGHTLFKVSLRTRSRKRAELLGRLISVKIDQLILNDNLTPEQFGEAMRLLKQWIGVKKKNSNFAEYEDLNFDDLDDWLLLKAENFTENIQYQLDQLTEERDFLRETVESLSKQNGNIFKESTKSIEEKLQPSIPDEENPTLIDCETEWHQESRAETISRSVNLFCRFMRETKRDDVRLNDLTVTDIRHYQKFAKVLPSRTIIKNKTIADLIQLQGEPRSAKTLVDEFGFIGTFLNWCNSRGYVFSQNILTVMRKGSGVKVTPESKKPRVPWTVEDLANFFNSDYYQKSGKFYTSAMYWVPIIAIHTGARMSEILSLETHNIKKDENIWVLQLLDFDPDSQDEHKRLKASGSVRTVPIHDQLIKLGFLDYAKACVGRLFPEEKRDEHRKFSDFQKRQGNLRKKFRIAPPNKNTRKDFHSLRHTVRTRLDELKYQGPISSRYDDGLIDAIVGHASNKRSIGEKYYTHSDHVKQKSIALNKLRYDFIEWDKIVRWNQTNFCRTLAKQKLLKI